MKSFKVLLICFTLGMIAYGATLPKELQALKNDLSDDDLFSTIKIMEKANKITRQEYIEKNPALELTKEEKDNGFVLFICNYLSDIRPATIPKREEVKTDINIFATPGEYEPAAFALYPVKNVNRVKVTIGDLKNEKGDVIPKENIVVKVVRYNANYLKEGGTLYEVAPEMLEKKDSLDLTEGICKEYWLTVKIPENAGEGDYKAEILVKAGDKASAKLILNVKVLPFALLTPPDVTYAHFYSVHKDMALAEKVLNILKEYGSNSVTPTTIISLVKENNKVSIDFSKADKFMDVYKKVFGTSKAVPLFDMIPMLGAQNKDTDAWTEEYLNDSKRRLLLIKDHAEKNNWPPVLMYLSSELGNIGKKAYDWGLRIVKEWRTVPDIRIVASPNGNGELVLLPYLDVVMYNASVPISEDTIKKAKDAKVELWYQNIGMTRYNEGFLLWRTGAKGRRQFYANGTIADPTAHWPIGLLYFTKKDILISLSLERGREGGDDLKYVYTLESLIKEAKKDGQDTKESEKVLEDIYKELPVNIAEYTG